MAARAATGIASALALTGCLLPEPNYDDTRFRCELPSLSCPDGFSCVDGWCEPPGNGGGGDPDAAPLPPDDDDPLAELPDAAPDDPDAAPLQTASFGERPGTDFAGVTTDTTLRNNNSDANFGGDDIVSVDADPIHIGLLRFDLSDLPVTAEVVTAALDIYASDPIETGEYQLHAMLLSWSENQATYDERSSGTDWPSPGAGPGTYSTALLGTLVAREIGDYTVILDPDVVQSWVSAPAANYGMRWSSTSLDGRGGTWEASESGNNTQRPQLRITYR
jgi:hypothetical protein